VIHLLIGNYFFVNMLYYRNKFQSVMLRCFHGDTPGMILTRSLELMRIPEEYFQRMLVAAATSLDTKVQVKAQELLFIDSVVVGS